MSESGYRLYGDRRSGNCYKAGLLLRLLGLEYDWVETNVVLAETRSEAFLEMNPNGRVPVLQLPDGRFLAESNAMLLHLSEGTRYLPADGYERALCYQWLFFEQYSHEPFIAVSRFIMMHGDGDDASRARLESKRAGGLAALKIMDDHLTRNDFFVDNRYSIADIGLYAYTHVADEGGFELGDYPALSAWLGRVASQPRYCSITDTF